MSSSTLLRSDVKPAHAPLTSFDLSYRAVYFPTNIDRYFARHNRTQREARTTRTEVFNVAAPIGP